MDQIKMNSRRSFLKKGISHSLGAAIVPAVLSCNKSSTEGIPESTNSKDPEVTRILSKYIVDSKFSDIPKPVVDEAIRSILNIVGCTIGGANHETTDIAISGLLDLSGSGNTRVMGRPERFALQEAALLYGISSHVRDYDDTHLKTIIHPAGPVASALFPLAEYMSISGEEFLHAFILGVEAECRIGLSVYPAHYQAGWHITGTAGVFGATAAVGKLLGLSKEQMIWAMGIAATESSGFKEMFGTMCKPFHPGNAARSGLMAAFLARKNFTSTNEGIEAKRSFAYVMSPERNFNFITEGLGKSYEVLENSYKPFSCGIVIHPVIDGCIQLKNEYNFDTENIEQITVEVNKLVLELTGKKTPKTGLEGKFSVYHSAAVALLYGKAAPKQYTDEVVNLPEVINLRSKVTAIVKENIREDQANLIISLQD